MRAQRANAFEYRQAVTDFPPDFVTEFIADSVRFAIEAELPFLGQLVELEQLAKKNGVLAQCLIDESICRQQGLLMRSECVSSSTTNYDTDARKPPELLASRSGRAVKVIIEMRSGAHKVK